LVITGSALRRRSKYLARSSPAATRAVAAVGAAGARLISPISSGRPGSGAGQAAQGQFGVERGAVGQRRVVEHRDRGVVGRPISGSCPGGKAPSMVQRDLTEAELADLRTAAEAVRAKQADVASL
jgi:hypothetical protein